jgi:GNAT superfamily N-acetyltransferase
MDKFIISEFKPGNEYALQCLIRTAFDGFVAPGYSTSGNEFFYEFIAADKILARFLSGNILLTAESGGRSIGCIEVRDRNHICLLFVEKEWHRKGVARALLNEALSICRLPANDIRSIEVNASPFSEKIYSKLGFSKVNEQQEVNGMLFVPMKMVL